MRKFMIRFISVAIGLGMISPSIKTIPTTYQNSIGAYSVSASLNISFLNQAEARRGGGARVGGMRSSGMRRSGGMSRSRMSSPRSNRYFGGSFQRSRPSARPVGNRGNFNSSRPNKSFTRQTRPAQRPSSRPSTRPVNQPGKSPFKPSARPVNKPSIKPINRPGNGNRPDRPNRPGNGHRPGNGDRPGNGHRPPHHGHPRPPHHGHHGHHHHYHPYYGGYWPWFWGSAIVVGAIVSTIPDDDCRDLRIDGKLYKECEGVLFEPVYEGDEVSYKVIKMEKK